MFHRYEAHAAKRAIPGRWHHGVVGVVFTVRLQLRGLRRRCWVSINTNVLCATLIDLSDTQSVVRRVGLPHMRQDQTLVATISRYTTRRRFSQWVTTSLSPALTFPASLHPTHHCLLPRHEHKMCFTCNAPYMPGFVEQTISLGPACLCHTAAADTTACCILPR